MNLHVIVVHYPIAFLTVYALFELLRFRRLLNQPFWFYVKAVLVILGSLGAGAALITGKMAKELFSGVSSLEPVVSLHEKFAQTTTIIFAVLAVSYLVIWLNRENFSSIFSPDTVLAKIWNFLGKLAHVLVETKLAILLALAGLICVTLTGGLGGAMAFGPDADPFFKPIYNLL